MSKFAFLVHQTSNSPFDTWLKLARTKWYFGLVPPHVLHYAMLPRIPLNFDRFLRYEATGIASGAFGTEGIFRALPYSTDYMRRARPADKVVEASRLCLAEGVGVIGLGAYNSIVTDGGTIVANALRSSGVAVTSGNSLTAWAAIEGLNNLCVQLNIPLQDQTVAVIGPGGTTGSAICNLLKGRTERLLLLGGGRTDLHPLAEHLGENVEICEGLDDVISRSQVIVSATNSPGALRINPTTTLPWKVFVDVARPRDVGKIVSRLPHVIAIDGGIFRVPGENVELGLDFGLPRGFAFACMAETMVLAMLDHTESHVGDLDPAYVHWIGEQACALGFRVDALRSQDRVVTEEKVTAMRELIAKRGVR